MGGRSLDYGEVRRLLRQKSMQRWEIPGSTRSRISISTVNNWIARYRASGNRLEACIPRGVQTVAKDRTIALSGRRFSGGPSGEHRS
ncbi:MAG TPA: hypothetical protein VLH56_02080 [Dissulfurispiraceae bacterium]|nr:hypothetical protein [Dissulfurispiraceae bacterium]